MKAVTVALTIGFLLTTTAVQAMEPEAIRTVIQQARSAWMTGDADAFAALFTADGELIVPGEVYRGPTAIRAVTAEFSQGHRITIQIRQIVVEGDRAVVEWHWQDTETATGSRNQADDAIVVDFQAGKIQRWREYIDTASPSKGS